MRKISVSVIALAIVAIIFIAGEAYAYLPSDRGFSSDVTVNGSDQKFNELMGREIQEVYGCEPQSLLIMPILPGTDGVEKMSQSLGNYIGLCESPDQQYGKTLSIPDALMRDFYTLCTRIPASEVDLRHFDGTLRGISAK